LSDAIGFHYHSWDDSESAAANLLSRIKSEFAARLAASDEDRIVTIALDGENAWGDYPKAGRPFLHALYRRLESDPEVQTVTFSEYLDGNQSRSVSTHRLLEQTRVYDLYTGSWVDETGSDAGVDLGTWIGDEEENRAWELLGEARHALARSGKTYREARSAFSALYAAEGSDWYWWFGSDQYSGRDDEFDDLYRMHLKSVYRGLKVDVPAVLDQHIVAHSITWTFMNQILRVQPGDRVTVQTNCPGTLTWQIDAEPQGSAPLLPVGGVMAGVHRYNLTLGPVSRTQKELTFTFHCTHQNCDCGDVCCGRKRFMMEIG
jgi:alpha-amylase/alpha-mannosidase (GH57 family)